LIGVLVRRALATLGLVLGTTVLLGVIFDSGLLGDSALREAGERAGVTEIGEARVRLGSLRSFDPAALRLRVDGAANRITVSADADGLLLLHDTSGSTVASRLRFPLDGDLATLAGIIDGTSFGGVVLHAEAQGDSSRPASGIGVALKGMRRSLEAGESAELGWGEPIAAGRRILTRVGSLLRLDFGDDRNGRPVAGELMARGGRSLMIALPAFVLTTALALLLALTAALLRGRVDRGLTITAALVIALPGLAWMLFLRDLLAFRLELFPVRVWDAPHLPLLLLPILTWIVIAVWPDLRLYRALAVEHADSHWARAARAAGVSRRRLLWRQLLPAIAAPVLARVALTLPYLFTGSLLLEHVYGIPGLGSAVVDAVRTHDESVLRACTFIFALGFLCAQWLADALAASLDPRLRGVEA
jgi:peptide/nickel transport system permease protein